jgi:hypothetical protein
MDYISGPAATKIAPAAMKEMKAHLEKTARLAPFPEAFLYPG